jgi:Rrf2 family protein
MTLSRECEYALKGLATLAAEGGSRPLILSEIAAREGLPSSFLSKIFHRLLQHGLVLSHRGIQRGYTLAREPSAIPVRAVLEAIEGPDLADRCLLWGRECSPLRRCLLHLQTETARRELVASLERTTLADLSKPPAQQKKAQPPPGRAQGHCQ